MSNKSLKMPAGVRFLYWIQAFSTFAYAILYSSLSLYLTQQLGLSGVVSNSLVGLFLALNHALHLVGGFMGGKFFSNRSLFSISTIIQSIGIVLIVYLNLYVGLSLFLIGHGLNTVCYNNLLTQQFKPDDSRRERAFLSSYAAMNAGFFAGFSISGFYDFSSQYHNLFFISLMTNLIGLLLLGMSWKNFVERKITSSDTGSFGYSAQLKGIIMIFMLIPLIVGCFYISAFSNGIIVLAGLIMFVTIFLFGNTRQEQQEKLKINTFLILGITSTIFWMVYYTGPMGVTLFIKNNVNKHIFNYEMATQWILSLNTIVIILSAPAMIKLNAWLEMKGIYFTVNKQFKWAFIFLACSFFFLSAGIQLSNEQGYVGITWVILHFIFQSLGELLIAPVGYAMIGRIIPQHLQGILMGSWMMISGVAASLSHYFSNEMLKTESFDPLITNLDYWVTFNRLGIYALAGALVLYFISQKMKTVDLK